MSARRPPLLALALCALPGAAQAQETRVEPGDSGYSLPAMQIDGYRPSVDATRTFAAEDSRRTADFTGRIEGQWIDAPLIWYSRDDSRTALVESVLGVNLSASWGAGPLRIGATLPLYPAAPSDYRDEEVAGDGAVIGDLSVDGKFSAIEGGDRSLGLAAFGRLTVPWDASVAQLGQPGFSGELGAAADYQAGRALFVANLYYLLAPTVALAEVSLGDQLGYRAGIGLEISERWIASAEVLGRTPIDGEARDVLTSPLEAIVGGRRVNGRGDQIRAGLGVGLLPGIGAPGLRIVLGVGHDAGEVVIVTPGEGDATGGPAAPAAGDEGATEPGADAPIPDAGTSEAGGADGAGEEARGGEGIGGASGADEAGGGASGAAPVDAQAGEGGPVEGTEGEPGGEPGPSEAAPSEAAPREPGG